MLFTLEDVSEQFSAENFHKGWQLFTEGRIAVPNVQKGGEIITAVAPNPDDKPFRIYVRTDKQLDGVHIHGECSCSQKSNCEHAAAALLQTLDNWQVLPGEPVVPPPSSTQNPQDVNKYAGQKKPTTIDEQLLFYVVQLNESGVLIETCVARHSKWGDGYSFVRNFKPSSANSRAPARFLEEVDLGLLKVLDQMPRDPATGIPRLSGPQSITTFEAILATGRCFFASIEWGVELDLGQERKLEIQWQVDDFGYQRADWSITPEADELIPLSSPWYLDEDEQKCGPLNTKLPMDLILELESLPAVAPDEADKVYQTLLKTYPGYPVPPLHDVEFETAPQAKPTPCLRLSSVEVNEWDDEWTQYDDFASLSFLYDDGRGGVVEISRHGPATRFIDGRLMRVQRDKKAENALVKQLQKLGLEEEGDNYGSDIEDRFVPDFDPMDNEVESWLDFQLEDLPKLRAQGWRIEYDNFRFQLAEADNWICDVEKLEKQDWFSIGLGVDVDGRRIDLLPILLQFLSHFPRGLPDKEDIATQHFILPFTDEQDGDRLLRLPVERVLPLLEILLEIYDDAAVIEKQNLHFSRVQLARLTALDELQDGPRLQWLTDEDTGKLAERLKNLDGIPEVTPPTGLKAQLRPYQQQGLNWLQFLREYQLAGILADDMGLGKTVQALAHLLLEKQAGRANSPSLVVAPTSLMFNWRHETQRFAPDLKVLVLHGPQRKNHFPAITDHDLVITTYPLLVRDKEQLLEHGFHLLILDEAQVIKNPKAQASRVVRDINARHRVCLTGTPMENHLGELWSLFDFLLPGLLGSSNQFKRFFRTPIEKHGNEGAAERLSRRVRPFLLRRTKQQVAAELPEKTEIIQAVALEDKQRELYETVRLAMHRRVREEIERQGMARSHIVVLDALLKLRQVCCDPRLVKTEKARHVKQSAKLETLMELVPEMIEEGRRILVFSQFTAMLDLIEAEVKEAGIGYVKLTGRTRDRETAVGKFQQGEVPLFLISLKAGGVGLNLTSADTVIHYDPWWNPAVERQATDRAHRIGQKQAVFVYKFICEGTLEEKIQAMQLRKQALADGLYQKGGGNEPQWDEQDIEELLGPLVD